MKAIFGYLFSLVFINIERAKFYLADIRFGYVGAYGFYFEEFLYNKIIAGKYSGSCLREASKHIVVRCLLKQENATNRSKDKERAIRCLDALMSISSLRLPLEELTFKQLLGLAKRSYAKKHPEILNMLLAQNPSLVRILLEEVIRRYEIDSEDPIHRLIIP